jgi:hypothetical protein
MMVEYWIAWQWRSPGCRRPDPAALPEGCRRSPLRFH